MTFADAVRSALTQYVGFRGRGRRSEYWWFTLFYLMVAVAAVLVDDLLGTEDVLLGIVMLGLFLPSLTVTVRRLHDIGRSGWWVLVGFVPAFGFILLLVFALTDSDRGSNRFGPSVKYPTSSHSPVRTQPAQGLGRYQPGPEQFH